jgi:hypothetical protein
MTVSQEPNRKQWRATEAARRAATAYQANREAAEPLVRLVADTAAVVTVILAALARRRGRAPVAAQLRKGSQA